MLCVVLERGVMADNALLAGGIEYLIGDLFQLVVYGDGIGNGIEVFKLINFIEGGHLLICEKRDRLGGFQALLENRVGIEVFKHHTVNIRLGGIIGLAAEHYISCGVIEHHLIKVAPVKIGKGISRKSIGYLLDR